MTSANSTSSASAPAAPALDFEALLSRARVTRLIPREAFKSAVRPQPPPSTRSYHHHHHRSGREENNVVTPESFAARRRLQAQETSRLVLSLVTQTHAFAQHLPESERGKTKKAAAHLLTAMGGDGGGIEVKHLDERSIPPSFHQVELEDWESKINWQGCPDDDNDSDQNTADFDKTGNAAATVKNSPSTITPVPSTASLEIIPSDAMALLKRRRNPHLDNIRFDHTTVCWDASAQELMEKARNVPLILQLGLAGQSVAAHVYQHTVLSAQRPTPALQSAAYQNRMDRDWSGGNTTTTNTNNNTSNSHSLNTTGDSAQLSKGLHTDKEHMEAVIQARQQKREQMEKEKNNRVLEAMGTLALGGGRGRTITSSLMGPGGTERTGRPVRASHSSVAHDSEYTEQLDMVVHHQLVRDLSKVSLRQYHRPKLPLPVVRQDLVWQLQICYVAGPKVVKEGGSGGGTSSSVATSYHSIMGGHSNAGALSREKLRSEADLTPSEGHLILMEYSEEKPPVQLTKGMAWKMINYYRGDKARCPVSRGGGDRPARRKRDTKAGAGSGSTSSTGASSTSSSRQFRLGGLRETTIMDWIGDLPKKNRPVEKEAVIDVLPEGKTEVLHPKVHGPFIGQIEEGTTLTGCISNLFVAPMFRYDAESTDFLMILTPGGAARAGQTERMGVVLRAVPICFTVGQTEPRTRVHAPNTQGEKSFITPFVSYQIARALARTQAREGHGLRFDELQDRILPNQELPPNFLRQRLKEVAIYDKNTQIWTSKSISEDYPGVEALGKRSSPEGVAAFESACALRRRLSDLGIHQLLERGSHTVTNVGVTMVYLAGQVNAARERARKTKKLLDFSRSNKKIEVLQVAFYERAANELENLYKMLKQKYEVAQFIHEELQLAPWHLTGEFIDVHKKGEGTGMMNLTGLGDPSGKGEGFSFLREADSKPTRSVGTNDALSAQVKKITGTEDDLRKLTMKQMASLLRSYGMEQKQIETLKRWDRVHVIRDLSTKAQSDGIGDGLERFARGEKMKLSEQKQMYRDRVQVIWRRQLAVLSMGDRGAAVDSGISSGGNEAEDPVNTQPTEPKTKDNDDSDDDSDDDDDLAAAFEDEMMDRTQANQLVAAHTRANEAENAPGQLRAVAQDQDVTKDARELAALKRQREEERQAKEGLQSMRTADSIPGGGTVLGIGRTAIRKRITTTHPDGRQTTTFKFVLHPEEVGKIIYRLQQNAEKRSRNREMKYDRGVDEKPPGHAMFEDDDDFEYSSKGGLHSISRRGGGRRRGGAIGGRGTPRRRTLQLGGKLKTRISTEERMRKRRREEDELEVYAISAKRKGTNNRRERGSIRDRRPHVIYAEKLEAIRADVEARPAAGPFQKQVNPRIIPRYYEVISHPIDLSTIRDRISRYVCDLFRFVFSQLVSTII
jgi:hypothetical protein